MRTFHTKGQVLALFMPGFLFGVLYVNFFVKQSISGTELFNSYFLKQYENMNLLDKAYILYLIRIRIVPLILLLILTFTKVKKISACALIVWTGFSSGMLLTLAALNMGIKGILLCVVGIIPQFLCYIVAYAIIVLYSWQYPRSQWNRQKTMVIVGCMMVGILVETYINPFLVKGFLKLL